MITSLVAFAGTSGAVTTTVSGPDEVTRGDAATFTSTVDVRDDERVDVRRLTLTIRTTDSPDEAVRVTVAPNGTVLSVTPSSGVVGQGEIRIAQLRRSLEVDVAGTDGTYGYGYGYVGGVDERAGENGSDADVGYGYGYADTAITVTASFDSQALKHGDYEVFLTIDTPEGDDRFRSNVQAFTVDVPGNGSPPDRGEGPDNRPDDSDENDSEEDDSDENDSDEDDSNEEDSDENDSGEDDSDENDSDEDDSNEEDSDENDSGEDDSDENDSDEQEADEDDDHPGAGNGPPDNRGNGNGPPSHANGNGPPSHANGNGPPEDVPRGGR
ncbi:hypothetical protein [Halobaculum litoreum]|uniref:hypothetical protein n=1 Tax=Halobaculum litoreum TaxID=3031998 RepID=UPI0024C3D1CC|nr:hypothetical protein [Halobaculum sp. DT92]